MMQLQAWSAALLFLIGAIFMFLGALGLLRQPDLLSRMQATGKASTMGIGCMFLAVAIQYFTLEITSRCILVILFVYTTVPVSNHLLARATYFLGVPLWKGMVVDELRSEMQKPDDDQAAGKVET